jgi:poly(3-hydroxybutyrate) depolymerase
LTHRLGDDVRVRVSRRALVAVLVIVAAGVLVSLRLLRDDPVRTGDAAAHGTTVIRYDVRSRYVHQTLPQVAAVPPGRRRARPLLVFLHGRGGNGEESNANEPFFAALAALGDRAPVVVFPSGGDHSYWHARRSGQWARYVLDEVIPEAVRRLHADPHRIALGGISMGGYGAYEIARLRPSAFCAVGGHSAALWLTPGDSAAGAFDDARDFTAHDVIARARRDGRGAWGRAKLWLDGGADDPFHAGDAALAHALGVRLHVWAGGHDSEYWDAHYRDYLRFYARALATC